MTDTEQEIVEMLGRVWNQFLKLPIEHESDIREFQYGIHVLQRQVMCRPTRRNIKVNKKMCTTCGYQEGYCGQC